MGGAPECAAIVSHAAETWSVVGWVLDKVVAPVLVGGAIITLGSKHYANQNEHNKAKRDHLNRTVDAALEELAAVHERAVVYWAQSGENAEPEIAPMIDLGLARIDTLVRISGPDLWASLSSKGPILVSNLMSAIIDQHFGLKTHKPDLARSARITHAAKAIAEELLASRSSFVKRRLKLFN